jgi:hypothetical protein
MKKYIIVLLISLLIGVIYSPRVGAGNPNQLSETEPFTPNSTTIEITYEGNWPAAAKTALEHAATIWEPLISSIPPIKIDAIWGTPYEVPLASTFTAGWGTSVLVPVPNTWYPEALLNAIAGYASCPSCEAMEITFDSSLPNWYFGTDGHPSASQYDFVTVALRQIGMGLGFAHSFLYYPQSGNGEWGLGTLGYPLIYDHFIFNGNNQQLINTSIFPNPSPALYAQMISGNIYFSGPLTIAANGNAPAKLYAPTTWWRYSFHYLGEYAFPTGTTNALMTPFIQPGEVIHHPGPVALAILYDLGWPRPNLTPTLAELPNQFLQINTVRNNAIDLWAYVNDDQPDNQLTFEITNSPAVGAGVTLDNNRYIDINPAQNWVGQTTVTVRVTDPLQATSSSSFIVIVADFSNNAYLPVIWRH